MSWKCISNAIKHEMYNALSSDFMLIVNSYQQIPQEEIFDAFDENINFIVEKLKQTTKNISGHEISYLRQLAIRARGYWRRLDTMAKVYDDRSNKKDDLFSQNNNNIGDNNVELNQAKLCDIFNNHNCFLFQNYQFQQYEKKRFLYEHIEKNNLLGNDAETLMIKAADIYIFNLFPDFIINDNMYVIWKYLFLASRVVHEMRAQFIDFTLQISVIPRK
eukprot:6483_1